MMTIIVGKWFKRGAALGLRWNLSVQLLKLGVLQLDACLPLRLKVLSQKFRMVPLLERCRHRIQRTKFWMDRMAALKSDEQTLKANMREDVRHVLADKKILLWNEMLQAINYEDMGVVDEFMVSAPLRRQDCIHFDCFCSHFTHVQSATQWTASVHTLHMSKPVITFGFKVLRNGLLWYMLYTCPNL